MDQIPTWILAGFYWSHMIATVAWLGGLAVIVFWIHPSERESVLAGQSATLTITSTRRLSRIAWFALIVLGVSGLFQMSASSQYQGVLVVENTWSVIIFIKHIVILMMTIVTTLIGFWILPSIRRLQLQGSAPKGINPESLRIVQNRLVSLLGVNLVLGIMILGLTAWARIQ